MLMQMKFSLSLRKKARRKLALQMTSNPMRGLKTGAFDKRQWRFSL